MSETPLGNINLAAPGQEQPTTELESTEVPAPVVEPVMPQPEEQADETPVVQADMTSGKSVELSGEVKEALSDPMTEAIDVAVDTAKDVAGSIVDLAAPKDFYETGVFTDSVRAISSEELLSRQDMTKFSDEAVIELFLRTGDADLDAAVEKGIDDIVGFFVAPAGLRVAYGGESDEDAKELIRNEDGERVVDVARVMAMSDNPQQPTFVSYFSDGTKFGDMSRADKLRTMSMVPDVAFAAIRVAPEDFDESTDFMLDVQGNGVIEPIRLVERPTATTNHVISKRKIRASDGALVESDKGILTSMGEFFTFDRNAEDKKLTEMGITDPAQRNFQIKLTEEFGDGIRRGASFKDGMKSMANFLAKVGIGYGAVGAAEVALFSPHGTLGMDAAIDNLDSTLQKIGDPEYNPLNFEYSSSKIADTFGVSKDRVDAHLRSSPTLKGKAYDLTAELAVPTALWVKGSAAMARPLGKRVLEQAAKKFNIDPKDVAEHYATNPKLYDDIFRDVAQDSLRLPQFSKGLATRRAMAQEKALRGFEELPEVQRVTRLKKLEKAKEHKKQQDRILREMENPKLTAADRSVLRDKYRKERVAELREVVESRTTRYGRAFARDELYVLAATAGGQQATYNLFDIEENMALDLTFAVTGAMFGELIVEKGGKAFIGMTDDLIESSRIVYANLAEQGEINQARTTGRVSEEGMRRKDAIRGYEVTNPKLFKKVKAYTDKLVSGLNKEELKVVYEKAQGMQDVLDKLTSYRAPDGTQLITEEDLPFTVADVVDAEMMRAIGSIYDNQLDLQSAGGLNMALNPANMLAERNTLSNRRESALIKLRDGYDNLLERDDAANFMDGETRRILEAQRIGIDAELKDLEDGRAATVDSMTKYKEGLEDIIRSGDTAVLPPRPDDATDETSSNSFRILEQHLEMAVQLSRAERQAGLSALDNLQQDLDAIEQASQFQKDAFSDIAEDMSVISADIDVDGYGGFLANVYSTKLAAERKIMKESYETLGEMGDEGDVYADVSGWFGLVRSREGRATFLDPKLMEEYLDPTGDPYDTRGQILLSVITAKDIVNTPGAWRGLVDNSATMYFNRSFDSPITGVDLVGDMVGGLGDAAEKYDVGPISREIDAWTWLKNFSATASAEDIARLDEDVIVALQLEDMSVESFREFGSEMDLPVSVRHATAMLAALNKAANKGTDEASKLAAQRARNELMTTLGVRSREGDVMQAQGGFFRNYFEEPEPDDQFTQQHARAMEASRAFYNRRDSGGKLGKAVVAGNVTSLNTSISSAIKNAAPVGFGPAETMDKLREGVIQPVLEAFGEWDAANQRWIITEENQEAVADYLVSMHAYLYKNSEAGTFIMETAARNGVGLGDYVTARGVESMLRGSDRAPGEVAVFANTPGKLDALQATMQNVKVHRRTGEVDKNGYPIYEETADGVVNADDFLNFNSIQFAKDIPEYQEYIDDNYFAVMNKQVDDLQEDLLNVTNARAAMLKAHSDELSKSLNGATNITTKTVSDYMIGDEGFKMMQSGRNRFVRAYSDESATAPEEVKEFRRLAAERGVDVSERGLMEMYDKEMARVISLAASDTVSVNGVFDLVKLRGMLDGTTPDGKNYVRALEEFNPEALSFLRDMRDFMERQADNPRISVVGKPLRLRPEAAINKFWQVSRRQVGVRYAVLELLFRANRFQNFSGTSALMSDPEAGRIFLKMLNDYAETGKAPAERDAEALTKLLIPVIASELAIQNNPDETARIYSINDVDSHLLKPSSIDQRTPFPVKLAGRTYLSEREQQATERQMKNMTGQNPQQATEQPNENLQ